MRLHWITRKEHDKLMEIKDSITMKWINKCNKLNKEIERNEDNILNLLDTNKEFALENEYLRDKVKDLENMVKWHESNECKLNKELCKSKGQLNKLDNFIKVTTGTTILEGDK